MRAIAAIRAAAAIGMFAALAACDTASDRGTGPADAGSAAPGGVPPGVSGTAAEAAAGAAADAAAARGELLSFACQACHSLARGGQHMIGPNLFGIFGRTAGTSPGFDNYSRELRESGFVWSPELLDRWLADPAGFLPGTTMAFTGYRSAEDRAALIAFLVAATGAPEAAPGP